MYSIDFSTLLGRGFEFAVHLCWVRRVESEHDRRSAADPLDERRHKEEDKTQENRGPQREGRGEGLRRGPHCPSSRRSEKAHRGAIHRPEWAASSSYEVDSKLGRKLKRAPSNYSMWSRAKMRIGNIGSFPSNLIFFFFFFFFQENPGFSGFREDHRLRLFAFTLENSVKNDFRRFFGFSVLPILTFWVHFFWRNLHFNIKYPLCFPNSALLFCLFWLVTFLTFCDTVSIAVALWC